MGWLKKTWNYLDGKKNKIANTILGLSAVATLIFPEYTIVYKVGAAIGIFAKTIGLGHKYQKGEIKLPDKLKKKK